MLRWLRMYRAPDEPPSGSSSGSAGDDGTNPASNGPGGTPGDEGGTPSGGAPQTWEAWLAAQPEAQRALITPLYEAHEQGLRRALDSERDQRKTLEQQLRGLTGKLEEGSEARQQLETITSQLETESRRADFYEDAAQAGVTNFKLAWLAVQDNPDAFTDHRGRVNFERLKERHPELFRSPQSAPPPGHAGAGRGGQPESAQPSMNDIIRGRAQGQ